MQILIVDDSKTIRFILRKILTELGYENLVLAGSVAEARVCLAKNVPDIIISDIHMPGGSGLDLLKFVRSQEQMAKTPFIVLTSAQEKKYLFEAMKSGTHHYILKPVDRRILCEKLEALSQTHGIRIPHGVISAKSAVCTPPPAAAQPYNGTSDQSRPFTQEKVDEIIEQVSLVLDGELTIEDLRSWLAETVFAEVAKSAAESEINALMDKVKAAAKAALMRLSERE